MEELVKIINLAMECFKQEYGDDAKLVLKTTTGCVTAKAS